MAKSILDQLDEAERVINQNNLTTLPRDHSEEWIEMYAAFVKLKGGGE